MICGVQCTLLDVMALINENTKGTTFIVDNENKLYGLLTDGDIRRLLMQGRQLHERVEGLANQNFVYATTRESYREILEKTSDAIKIIPIVNDNFEVVDFFEISNRLHVPAAVPSLGGNEFKYVVDAFLSSWISSTGKYVDKFETDFSKYIGGKYGVATSNGTTALHLALEALGIGAGDEVIVPDLTFAATINSVLHANATPVIVDVEKESWCIDAAEIEKYISPNTKAVIPVHLCGQPCDMDAVMQVARKHNLYVVEDCAQAHGAEFNGKKVGSFGDISCFSFFANKIITTGEGGMCITNSAKLNTRMRILRDHGMSQKKKYWHDVVGYNYRMTNLQAAIGLAQLERIDEMLRERGNIEKAYKKILKFVDCLEFQADNLANRRKVVWFVCALINEGKRDDYLESLQANGIDARPMFHSLSTMKLYKKYNTSSKSSKKIAKAGILFPASPLIVNNDVLYELRNIFTNNMGSHVN
jgi:perosamine synthetase